MFAKRRVSLAAFVALSLLLASCNDNDANQKKDVKQSPAQSTSATTPTPEPRFPDGSSVAELTYQVLGSGYAIIRTQNDNVEGAVSDDGFITKQVIILYRLASCPIGGDKKFTIRPEAPVAIVCKTDQRLFIPAKTMETHARAGDTVKAIAVVLYGSAFQVFNQNVTDDSPIPTPLTACAAGVMVTSLGITSAEQKRFEQFYPNSNIQSATKFGFEKKNIAHCLTEFSPKRA